MTSRVQRPDPPYMQVVAHIREQITSGQLRDGDTVPSARQIAREWEVSLATATKVLASLRSEGLVRGIPGVGSVVSSAETLLQGPKDRFTKMRRTGRIYPDKERAAIKSAEVVSAPQQVADALDIEVGANVIRRHRVTVNVETQAPVSASTSWFDGALAETAPQLLVAERLPEGTPGYIEQVTGWTATAGRDQVAAGEATEQEAHDLQIDQGTAVLRGRNWLYDAQGSVIEYGESTAVAGRWSSHDYELGNA